MPKTKTMRATGEVMHEMRCSALCTAVMRRFLIVAREVMCQFPTACCRGGDSSVPYCHRGGDALRCGTMRRFLTAGRRGGDASSCDTMHRFLTAVRCHCPGNGAHGHASMMHCKLLRCITHCDVVSVPYCCRGGNASVPYCGSQGR